MKVSFLVLGIVLILGVCLTNLWVVGENIDSSLVGYWSFDEGKGDVTKDNSINKNDGKIYGPVWAAGKVGSALSFDGIDDCVAVPYSGSLSLDLPFTLEAWFYPTALYDKGGYEYLYVIDRRSNYNFTLHLLHIVPAYYDGVTWRATQSDGQITLNTWNYVVVTFNKNEANTEINIYINGVRDAGSPVAIPGHPVKIGTDVLSIGREPTGTGCFAGQIDEVRIHARILEEKEIKERYEKVIGKTKEYEDNKTSLDER